MSVDRWVLSAAGPGASVDDSVVSVRRAVPSPDVPGAVGGDSTRPVPLALSGC
ncbi:hypothetical protein GFS60_06025 [Rhodococcus sp. WAY2]|nr:hypothetical protein GFS60_06025 [Rhodococcus sp. WAY2]